MGSRLAQHPTAKLKEGGGSKQRKGSKDRWITCNTTTKDERLKAEAVPAAVEKTPERPPSSSSRASTSRDAVRSRSGHRSQSERTLTPTEAVENPPSSQQQQQQQQLSDYNSKRDRDSSSPGYGPTSAKRFKEEVVEEEEGGSETAASFLTGGGCRLMPPPRQFFVIQPCQKDLD